MCQQQFLEGSQANKPSARCMTQRQTEREGGKIIKMRGQEDFKLLRADERGQVGGEKNVERQRKAVGEIKRVWGG